MSAAESSSGGVVTLLFTDLVGSTELLDRLGDDAAEEVRRRHFTLLRRALSENGGSEVKNLGDGLMASFASPLDALRCAVAMQQAVARANRTEGAVEVAIRIGLQAGEAIVDDGDFFGTSVVVAKRLCDRAGAGQILAADLIRVLVGSRGGFRFTPAGRLTLKGLAEPLAAVVVEWEASRPASPAPAALVAPAVLPRRRSSRGASNLVGRQQELARLDAELARAQAGELRCVLITGEPGVGKTRLADEFARLHGGSAHILSARAYPLGGTLPFSLWVEALEPALATMQGEDVDRLCGGFVDDLGGLFHSVAAIRPGAPRGDPPRLRLLEGLTHILDALSTEHPVIAALDDVHLADPSSWDVIRHLARRLPDGALLVLATARPAELADNDVAARVLLELEQDGGLTRLSVGPFARADLSALAEVMIEQTPPPALVDWLEDRTRGNVLFANGLLRALLEEGADLTAPRLERFPESLTERVIARIKDQTDDEKTTLELIAVLGRPAAIGELVAITGRSLEDLAQILGVLVSVRAVTEEERGRDLTYEIHHPLVRDVIYRAIGGARRRLLHRQVAAALRRNGRIGEAARHFARSADAGDSDAIDTLREAIQQAEAREAYREALELLGELGDLLPAGDPRWLDVSEAMSWRAEWVVDHRADTHSLLGIRALRELDGLLAGSPDASRRAAVKFRLANFLAWGTGDLKEAGAALEEAVTLSAESGDARQTLLVERELAWVKGLDGQLAAMKADALRIATAADAMGDRFVRLQALAAAAYAAIFLGRFREAEDWLRDALAIAQEDLKAYRYTALAAVLGTSLALEGRIDEACALFDGAKMVDPAYHDSVLLELEIVMHWLGGDFRTAVDRARESSAWNPTGHSRRRAIGDVFAARAALELGEIAEMQRFLARSRRALGTRDWSHFVQQCEHAEALQAYSQGRAAEAVAGLRRSSVTMLGRGLDGWVGLVLIDQAEIEAAIGDPSAARESAAQLRSIADRTAIPAHRGLAALASSFAEHAAGNLSEAAADARSAIAELATTGWRAYLARAHMALGRASAGTDRPRAVAAFGQAVELFEAAGATGRRQAAVDAVRALGSPGRRAAAAAGGPGSLTARERDVARLAASGLSAKEIADRLFVSERTVETHLTRVYAKLAVTTKVELVRRAGEFSL